MSPEALLLAATWQQLVRHTHLLRVAAALAEEPGAVEPYGFGVRAQRSTTRTVRLLGYLSEQPTLDADDRHTFARIAADVALLRRPRFQRRLVLVRPRSGQPQMRIVPSAAATPPPLTLVGGGMLAAR